MPSDKTPLDLFQAVTGAAPGALALPAVESTWVRLLATLLEIRADVLETALRDEGWLDEACWGEDFDPQILGHDLKQAGIRVAPRSLALIPGLRRFFDVHRGDGDDLREAPTERLQIDLRKIAGVGRATADRILAEALDRPVYPVDRGSYRVAYRHGWVDESIDEAELHAVFEAMTPGDPASLRQLAAGFGAIATRHCRPRRAMCEACPLEPWLPQGGPIDPAQD